MLLELTTEHVQALEALMMPVDQWDATLVCWLLGSFDAESKKQFDFAYLSTDVLTFKKLTKFMDRESCALEFSGDQPFPRRLLRS